jgi:hypothetical protein
MPRGRPRLGTEIQSGRMRQARLRDRRESQVRIETWVSEDVALFFRRVARQSGVPFHQAIAAALVASQENTKTAEVKAE